MSFFYSLLGFVLMLGILVFVHEWGHYIVARLFKVKVLRFSIGFGPVIARIQRGETEWAISAVPLGGYVKMLDEREGPVPAADRIRAFSSLPPWKRVLIVFAGPGINLLFAWLLFAFVYWVGYDTIRPALSEQARPDAPIILQTVDHRPVWSWGDVQAQVMKSALEDQSSVVFMGERWPDEMPWQRLLSLASFDVDKGLHPWLAEQGLQPAPPPMLPIVGRILPNSPAEQAGLQKGDVIIAVNGKKIDTWQKLVSFIAAHPNAEVTLSVLRNGHALDIPVVIGARSEDGAQPKWFLGVGVDTLNAVLSPFKVHVKYGVLEALEKGYQRGVDMLFMTLEMMKKMVLGQASLQNLSGPVSIAQFSGQALADGWRSFVLLMALLSLSLGVLNLLPIPLLDGGHILMDLYEWIVGKPLPETVQVSAQKAGLIVLLLLTFLALTNDMVRLLHE